MAKAGRSGPIGLRLALAFVGVALSAVAVFGLLSAVFAADEVSTLASSQRTLLTQALEVASADAWRTLVPARLTSSRCGRWWIWPRRSARGSR